jgi:hypothetical protein
MADPDFVLTKTQDKDGRVTLQRVQRGTRGTGEILKEDGRILTLTAREAVACGLAKGIITQSLGITGWQQLGLAGWTPLSGPEGAQRDIKDLSTVFSEGVRAVQTTAHTRDWSPIIASLFDDWMNKEIRGRTVRYTVDWREPTAKNDVVMGTFLDHSLRDDDHKVYDLVVFAEFDKEMKPQLAALKARSYVALKGIVDFIGMKTVPILVQDKTNEGYLTEVRLGSKEKPAVLVRLKECVLYTAIPTTTPVPAPPKGPFVPTPPK